MDHQLQAELDKIIESCRTKDKWDNADRQRLKAFRAEIGSPTEVAQAIGISVATLHWWEKQESPESEHRPPPPERHLKKMEGLIVGQHLESLLKASPDPETKRTFYDVLLRMRSVQDIMERASLSSRFWVLRYGRPFVAGNDPKSLDLMIRFMKKSDSHVYFVYRQPRDSQEAESHVCQAKESFDALIRQLSTHPEAQTVREKIHGVPVSDEDDANRLGMVDPWMSYAMAEYSQSGYDEYQKSIDAWVEFVFDVSTEPQEEKKKLVWLELPTAEAHQWREKRIEILKRLAGENPP